MKRCTFCFAQDLNIIIRNGSFGGYGISTNISTCREDYGHLVKITKTITVSNGSFFSAWLRTPVKGFVTRETSSITFRPSVLSPSCTQRSQMVSFVQTACPTGISARLVPQFPCAENYSLSIPVPGIYRHESALGDVIALVEPGLPCESPYYGDGYSPKLALYYFDTFVENITVDFYAVDVNGRNDYSYSLTEVSAGCTRNAQSVSSWESARIQSVGSKIDWSPQTYRNCFSGKQHCYAQFVDRHPPDQCSGGRSVLIMADVKPCGHF